MAASDARTHGDHLVLVAVDPRVVIAEPDDRGLSGIELAELCHEVNNVLAVVVAHAHELLQRTDDKTGEHDRRALLAIKEGALFAAGLLARPTTERAPNYHDLHGLVAKALRQMPAARRDAVVRRINDDEPLVGYWDAQRVVQALINLLQNAAKYSPTGAPIVVTVRRVADNARVTIRDHGIGVSDSERLAIFDGQRTAPARETAPGHGYGLRLSRRLIEAEGGRLWLEDSCSGGSTFTIELPLCEATLPATVLVRSLA